MPETEVLIAPYGINPKTEEAYPPNSTQQKVLEWVDKIRAMPPEARDHIFVLYLQGGVGSGKSRALLAPVIELLLQIPELRVLWGRQDFKDLKLSIMDIFFEIVPEELFAKRNEQYHVYHIAQNEGRRSRITFNGLKDLSGLGSQEFGVIVVTEVLEISEQIYRALKRRCRQQDGINIILMEGEAPNEGHWLANLTDPTHENYDKDIEQWFVDTRENWKNLPVAYRNSLLSMPDAWKKKYLRGGYGFIPDGTPFYTGFKEMLHVQDLVASAHKSLILGWDYAFRHPACAITQMDAKGRLQVLREILGTDIIIDQFADVVQAFLNLEFPGFSHRSYGDPAGADANDKTGEVTSEDILRSKGFNVLSKGSKYRERKEIIEGKLSTVIQGVPALVVDNHCKIIIDGFLGGYHYPMIKQGQQFTTVKTEIPYADGYYEHLMNALEYIMVNLFKPVQRSAASAKKSARYHEIADQKNAGFGFGR